MSINNSEPVDLENGGLSAASERSSAGANMANEAQQGRYVRDLDASLGLLVVYYIGFVFVLVNFAEKWWHALLGIVFATACLMLSLCMAANLKARIMGEDAVEPSGTDSDLTSKLVASGNTEV